MNENDNQAQEKQQVGRYLVGHIVNPANYQLQIVATDIPGADNAPHRYEISGFDAFSNVSAVGHECSMKSVVLLFQKGLIKERGVNGITHEALLEVVADRLRSFQTGPYACRENALALTKIEEAMHWLQQRTIERMRRGVEGTHQI